MTAMTHRFASFSPCGTYRYDLSRVWDECKPVLVCCLINPSVADGMIDDNTVKVLMKYAARGHAGGLVIVNLFALVSTDPRALSTHPDPVGPDNERYQRAAFARAGSVVLCGWGDAGAGEPAAKALRLIREAGARPVCIAVTKSGNPGHPLRKRLPLQPFDFAEGCHVTPQPEPAT